MTKPLDFYTSISKDGWTFPIAPLTARSLATINDCARCPNCRGRVTLNAETCKCGHRYVNHNRWFGRMAKVIVPFSVSSNVRTYQVRRYRSWQSKQSRLAMLADADGWHTRLDIQLLWQAQRGRCYYCNKGLEQVGVRGGFHVDHRVSIADGGDEWPANLALTCAFCNQSKGMLSERAMWGRLTKARGSAWVAKRRIVLRSIKKVREEIDLARRAAVRRRQSNT